MRKLIIIALLEFSSQALLAGNADVYAPAIEILRDSGEYLSLTDKVYIELRATDDNSISQLKYEVRNETDNTLLWSGEFGTAKSGNNKTVVTSMGIEASALGTGSFYVIFTAYDLTVSPNISVEARYDFEIGDSPRWRIPGTYE